MRPTVESWLAFENKPIRNPSDRRNAKRCGGLEPVHGKDELLLNRRVWRSFGSAEYKLGRAGARPYRLGFSLIEMLVVLTIIAAIAALITTAVLSALQQQNARVCQNNMLTIEAAKDEYIRDHPGATSIDTNAFAQYFRFGIPKCPDGGTYNNLYVLTQQVICSRHGALQAFPSATP
ncbi:MAG: prepilin-type N-terminal cleavage/methylation domain-containing protein [Verrucomicrobia bacterium]|nr:prepilin-type N-terminal cleavage/methylation domain-containing protein [Verrucomicrobiota bacterium]